MLTRVYEFDQKCKSGGSRDKIDSGGVYWHQSRPRGMSPVKIAFSLTFRLFSNIEDQNTTHPNSCVNENLFV